MVRIRSVFIRLTRLSSIVFAAAVFTLAGCRHKSAGVQTTEHRVETTPVTVATVTNVAWDKSVSIVGTLYPKDEATIGAQVEGTVEQTLVDFGDRIRANQDVAFIDTASYEAQLQQAHGNLAKAEANLDNARQNFARTEQLKKEGIASASDFDLAKAQLDQWTAEVKAAKGSEAVAKLNLDRSRVKAPFDAAVSQRLVGRGDFVKVGSPLFHVVNDSVLKFIFQVPERNASLVKKQLNVRFTVDNYPQETFEGRVYLISPSVLATSRSFNVGALVTNTDFRLKANTFARGSIVLERGVPTPSVPLESVVSFAGVTKVFVVEGKVARNRTVHAGRIQNGKQEILDGVHVGEVVIVTGQNHLSDGSPVTVQSSNARTDAGHSAQKAEHAAMTDSHETR